MLNDAGKEIDGELLSMFLKEAFEVMDRLSNFLNDFTKNQDISFFESYAEQIERISGAASTLSLNQLSELTGLGKDLALKASQISDLSKLLVVQSLLGQLLRVMEKNLKGIKKGQKHNSDEILSLIKKLNEANNQLGDK